MGKSGYTIGGLAQCECEDNTGAHGCRGGGGGGLMRVQQ